MTASRRFYCYLLECSDGSYYTGWTTDPRRRATEHNAGRGARYTRARRPVRLVYVEALPTRSAAQQREYHLRKLSHAEKRALIEQTSSPFLSQEMQPYER